LPHAKILTTGEQFAVRLCTILVGLQGISRVLIYTASMRGWSFLLLHMHPSLTKTLSQHHLCKVSIPSALERVFFRLVIIENELLLDIGMSQLLCQSYVYVGLSRKTCTVCTSGYQ
jgi:hypothetical protein